MKKDTQGRAENSAAETENQTTKQARVSGPENLAQKQHSRLLALETAIYNAVALFDLMAIRHAALLKEAAYIEPRAEALECGIVTLSGDAGDAMMRAYKAVFEDCRANLRAMEEAAAAERGTR